MAITDCIGTQKKRLASIDERRVSIVRQQRKRVYVDRLVVSGK
jgi:hypothetical protein